MQTSKFTIIAILALIFSGCTKAPVAPVDEPPIEEPPVEQPPAEEPRDSVFILTTKAGLFGKDVIVSHSTLDEGTVSPVGAGIEQSGERTYFTHNDMLFSFKFGFAGAGDVIAYKANADKKLEKVTELQTETMHTYGAVGDDILMIKNSWQPAEDYMQWYRFDTKKLEIVASGEINTKELAGLSTNEMAFFTDVKQVGNKVFMPYWSIQSGQNFRSSNPDQSYMAVFSYPDMKLEKVIKDTRTGSIGIYFRSSMEVDEHGDLYAIGTKLGPDMAGNHSSKTPVAIMKIKNGTTEYDKTYFFNITAASEGHYIYQKLYLGKGNFLLIMATQPNTYGTTSGAMKYAIANVYDASFKWVTGGPESIFRATEYSNNYSPRDGKTGYIGFNTGFNTPGVVYKFDAETATAAPALGIEAAGITAINMLYVTK